MMRDANAQPGGRLPALARAMRPGQWTKNAVVLAAYFFARWDPSQRDHAGSGGALAATLLAAAAFCAASSAAYLVNDIHDRADDRAHPRKRFRPLASGALTVARAAAAASALAAAGLAVAFAVSAALGAALAAYLVLQAVYTYGLRRVAFVDAFVIAAGFVIRAVGGAVAIDVRISPWLLLCAFLLALFLALCKRRHEKARTAADESRSRSALGGYDDRALDQAIAVVSAATVVSYALYTLSEETVGRFGTNRLGLTIPFVLFGILRYLDLVYRQGEGERPERVLLTDRVLMATILLYGMTALAVFQLAKGGL